ncbi:2-oxoacid dehydrogenases acyltransferase-domain-containing protein [Gongronella butleri]|nr:2-oxoacid dehydrogenases acyltransferase-domain-containing protein [Gongronella butleri]
MGFRALSGTPARFGIQPFLLADIGEGITECEVIQWHVKPGDKVAEFDKICEVQSDKASVEITSRFAGTVVKLYHDVNAIAKVGEPLVDIETADGAVDATLPADAAAAAPEVAEKAPAEPFVPASTAKAANGTASLPDASSTASFAPASGDQTLATPAVRRLAKEQGVDLRGVRGTGKEGRILKDDVLAYAAGSAAAPSTTTPSAPSAPVAGGDRAEPLTMIQKAMFKSMTKSLAIPQLGYMDEIELNQTTEYRRALNVHISRHPQTYAFQKMSYLPIFIKCMSIALQQYPLLNATMGHDVGIDQLNNIKLTYRAHHNIGIAMDTPQGLIVPNIKNVQDKTILQVAADLHRLTELGKKNAIPPADLQGGTITLSNIGAISGTYANPVVISSEMAIVALGRMQTLPRFADDGSVIPKQILPVSWSADHRIIDGATIARFGELWKTLIENPALLASELR